MGIIRTLSAGLLLAQLAPSDAFLHAVFKYHNGRMITREEYELEQAFPASNANNETIPASVGYFEEQRVDHFNPTDDRLFRQKYFYDDQYWGGDGFPIFILLGGEGAITPSYLSGRSSQMMEYAKKFNAMGVVLEHRFYGAESMPTGNYDTESLYLHNSQQALADAAWFIDSMTKKWNSPHSPWIVFGGSYAGCLTAWMRQKYPHLVIGGVSSGGPVNAKTNFVEFFEQTVRSIEFYGGRACSDAIANATARLYELSKTAEGMAILKDKMKLCSIPTKRKDIDTMLNLPSAELSGTAQYNNNKAPNLQMEAICRNVTKAGDDPFENFMQVFQAMTIKPGTECNDVSYDAMVESYKQTTVDPANVGRGWLWQTCQEFGFFQTTDSPDPKVQRVLGHSNPVQYALDTCYEVFGKAAVFRGKVGPQEDHSNTMYGGMYRYGGTNAVIINGNVDPWHTMGILKISPINNVYSQTIIINGGSHCIEMSPVKDTEPKVTIPGKLHAQESTVEHIKTWLANHNEAF